MTLNYVKCKALFKFIILKRVHFSKNIAGITFKSLDQLRVLQKLLTIIIDNALNNEILVKHLYY
jgi:hypothetical protein